MSIYLGIDYGEKHLGVALADGPLATPLTSLDMEPVRSLPLLARLASENHVDTIVVGITEGKLAPLVRSFGSELGNLTGLPIVFHEESLTTKEAIAGLRAAGAKKSKLAEDHKYAACLILEDYLESQQI